MRDYTKVRIFQLRRGLDAMGTHPVLQYSSHACHWHSCIYTGRTRPTLGCTYRGVSTAAKVEIQADIRLLHSFWLDVPPG